MLTVVALARYQDILEAPDAWQLDPDTGGVRESRMTYSSLRIKDLLETITLTYKDLDEFRYHLRFLLESQIAILDAYHERLQQSLDAFESISFRVSHVLPGVYVEDAQLVTHVAGAERLCRAYGSGWCLESAMNEWNEQIVRGRPKNQLTSVFFRLVGQAMLCSSTP